MPASELARDETTLNGSGLFSTVVAGGYCVGCGVCALVSKDIEMEMTPLGLYQAARKNGRALEPEDDRRASAVCPFSSAATDEDELAHELFGAETSRHDEIGHHLATFAGHVAEADYRDRGSSGGLGTWLAAELLRRELVDAVLHVRPSGEEQADGRRLLFSFAASGSLDELREGARSRYYPVTLAGVLARVKSDPTRRYAVIGVPCFIKAVRLLAREEPVFDRAIRFCIGLVCGHLKSAAFAELLAWQAGITPNELTSVNFREKLPLRKASRYGFKAEGLRDGRQISAVRPMSEVFGGDWGLGMFKYKACDYCDDVVAETADVVVGDAWLPQFEDDSRGTNVLVIRNPEILELVDEARAEGRLNLVPLTADEVAQSQRAGLRHRREGLSVRLAHAAARGEWAPPRRVLPGSIRATPERESIYTLREQLAALSHQAFAAARQSNDLAVFRKAIDPTVAEYQRMYRKPFPVRLVALLRGKVRRIWRLVQSARNAPKGRS